MPRPFALVEPQHLRLGVLAPTLEGHDPYCAPGFESQPRPFRSIPAPRTLAYLSVFASILREMVQPIKPVGTTITGET